MNGEIAVNRGRLSGRGVILMAGAGRTASQS